MFNNLKLYKSKRQDSKFAFCITEEINLTVFHAACFILTVLLFLLPASLFASPSPGSPSDPLVAKSYLDHLTLFRLETFSAGSSLTAPRGGSVIAVSGEIRISFGDSNGVAVDVTAGKRIAEGGILPQNHLVIISSASSCVLTVRANSSIMLKGIFDINNSSGR
ncbi:MAG: hypothetical protein GX221_04645 [Candidatus Riflebacteria bacterium]|nr:hypothetical protein [Candidatus Riflebacteria bacterium]